MLDLLCVELVLCFVCTGSALHWIGSGSAPTGRRATFTTSTLPPGAGGAIVRFTFIDGTTGSFVMSAGAYHDVCVDPNETKWNELWYNVDYYPNANGVLDFEAALSSTPCS